MLRPAIPEEDIPLDPGTLVRVGRIASVDLDAGTCRVTFGDPDSAEGEVETADIRWATARAGETGVWLPPSVGEQVIFLCPDGELSSAVALAALPSSAFPAAGSTPRALIRFADGGAFAYDPQAHHCDIALPAGATLAIAADGGLSITGDVTITGNLDLSGTLTAAEDVVGGGKSLKTHRHPGVQSGTAQTGEPA